MSCMRTMRHIRIDNSVMFEGSLPSPQFKAIKKWMKARRPAVALAWVQVQAGKSPDKVPPP